jgi:hypothetical protein
MEDHKAIDELLSAKGTSERLIDEDGVEIDSKYIMGRMNEIGKKITQVSRWFKERVLRTSKDPSLA